MRVYQMCFLHFSAILFSSYGCSWWLNSCRKYAYKVTMSSIYDVCWYLFFINNRWFWLLNVQYVCWDCRPFYRYLLYSVLDLCWRKDGRCSSVHNILMIFEWCSKVVVVKIFFVMWFWSLWCVRPFPIWTKNILTSDSLWFCLLTLCI